jgi:hypothetical protein
LAEMEHLFGGLSYVVSEDAKLSILKRNVRQSYKIPLVLVEVRTVEELRKFCRRLDGTDESWFFTNQPVVQNSVSRTNIPVAIASNNTANRQPQPSSNPVGVPRVSSTNPFKTGTNVQGQFVCYNCGGPNHRSQDCLQKKPPIVCFGCGEAGHIRTKCPHFSGNGSARTG